MHKKLIFASPLDWGLGHLTRLLPLLQEFKKEGARVILFCTQEQARFLKKEEVKIPYIVVPGYNIRYSKLVPAWMLAPIYLYKVIVASFREHFILKAVLKRLKPDLIISDNRYGFFNAQVPSVVLTHQVLIKAPPLLSIFEVFGQAMHLKMLLGFNEIWVPDLAHPIHNLSGILGHSHHQKNIVYLGVLSRMSRLAVSSDVGYIPNKKFDLCILLSGPEPYRSDLEDILLEQILSLPQTLKVCLIRGSTLKPSSKFDFLLQKINSSAHLITVHSIASALEVQEILHNSKTILCRSGYSTLMDLFALQKTAILIPTPGQTEQVYLAKLFENKFDFVQSSQKKLNLQSLMVQMDKLLNKQLKNNSPNSKIHSKPSSSDLYLLENLQQSPLFKKLWK